MLPSTPAASPSLPPRARGPRGNLRVAFGVAVITAAVAVPLWSPFAIALGLAGVGLICISLSHGVHRFIAVSALFVVLAAAGNLDRGTSDRIWYSPAATRVLFATSTAAPAAETVPRGWSRPPMHPLEHVDDVRIVYSSMTKAALVVGRPRWSLLWAEGRLANGEHVLGSQDARTGEWRMLDVWATTTPEWLRELHRSSGLGWSVSPEKRALCNCTP